MPVGERCYGLRMAESSIPGAAPVRSGQPTSSGSARGRNSASGSSRIDSDRSPRTRRRRTAAAAPTDRPTRGEHREDEDDPGVRRGIDPKREAPAPSPPPSIRSIYTHILSERQVRVKPSERRRDGGLRGARIRRRDRRRRRLADPSRSRCDRASRRPAGRSARSPPRAPRPVHPDGRRRPRRRHADSRPGCRNGSPRRGGGRRGETRANRSGVRVCQTGVRRSSNGATRAL